MGYYDEKLLNDLKDEHFLPTMSRRQRNVLIEAMEAYTTNDKQSRLTTSDNEQTSNTLKECGDAFDY